MRTSQSFIKNLFLDNNILSRILKSGIYDSFQKINEELYNTYRKTIDLRQTNLIITPSNMFEYIGIKSEDFITSKKLVELCKVEDTGDWEIYFEHIHHSISSYISKMSEMRKETFINLLNRKKMKLPTDSIKFIDDRILKPILTDPYTVERIHKAITFHLFCGIKVKKKYLNEHHFYLVQSVLYSFKVGHITSMGKAVPIVWDFLKKSPKGKEEISHEERNNMSKVLGMHEIGDFLDSDLIHLASVGFVRNSSPQSVYCLTEDPHESVQQRISLYSEILRSNAKLNKRAKVLNGIDFRYGHAICFSKKLEMIKAINVKKLK